MRSAFLLVLLVATAVVARHYLEHPELWPRAPRETPVAPRIAPAAPEPQAADEPRISAEMPRLDSGEGAVADDRACAAPPTAPVAEKPAATIHRWVDAQGQVHFGDRAPGATASTVVKPAGRPEKSYFTLNIHYHGIGKVPFLEDRIRADLNRIYEHLSDLVGGSRLRQVVLNLRIFDGRDAYQAYAAGLAPGLASMGGFYSLARNEAVTWRRADDAETLATARHEAMHVIAAGLFGGIPIWLNEGLAEYFEGMVLEGSFARVPEQPAWLQVSRQAVANHTLADLREYLELPARDWYAPKLQTLHYALAWSLVFFLLDTEDGRAVLQTYLAELADNYCQPIDQIAWLDSSYPDGIDGLVASYRRWLNQPGGGSHYF